MWRTHGGGSRFPCRGKPGHSRTPQAARKGPDEGRWASPILPRLMRRSGPSSCPSCFRCPPRRTGRGLGTSLDHYLVSGRAHPSRPLGLGPGGAAQGGDPQQGVRLGRPPPRHPFTSDTLFAIGLTNKQFTRLGHFGADPKARKVSPASHGFDGMPCQCPSVVHLKFGAFCFRLEGAMHVLERMDPSPSLGAGPPKRDRGLPGGDGGLPHGDGGLPDGDGVSPTGMGVSPDGDGGLPGGDGGLPRRGWGSPRWGWGSPPRGWGSPEEGPNEGEGSPNGGV
jgi:hypothetical protein